MSDNSNEAQSLAQCRVVRASGGPLREVKVELGIVLMILICIWFVSMGVDAAQWLEIVSLLGASSCGAGWVAWRTRRRARQIMAGAEEYDDKGS